MGEVFVCKKEDDFVYEQVRWLAHLSNGQTIIQDDNRPGVDPPQAWIRLGQYCKQERVNIVNLSLQFRSHHESPLPANADGYYFINKAVSVNYGPTIGFYIIGYLKDEQIRVQQWRIPELVCYGEEIRLPDGGLSLIRRVDEYN